MAVSDLAQQFGSEQILGLIVDCADTNSLSKRISELEKAWEIGWCCCKRGRW